MGNTVNILLKPLEAYLNQAHLRGGLFEGGVSFNLSKTGHHTVFKINLNFQHIIQSTLPD